MKAKHVLFTAKLIIFFSCTLFGQANKDSLLNIVKANKNDSNMAKALIYLGKLEMQSDLDSSMAYFNKAVDLSKTKKYHRIAGDAYTNLGIIYFSKGNLDKAAESFTGAYEIYIKGDHKGRAARAITNLGFIYYNKGDLVKALENYQKALKVLETSDDRQAIATNVTNITAIYYTLKKYDKMIEYFNIGLRIFEKAKDSSHVANMHGSLYLPYFEMNKMDTAFMYLQRSEKEYRELNDEQSLAFTYNNFGGYYEKMKDLGKAEEYIQRSIDISTKLGDQKQLSFSYNGFADLLMKKGKYKEAIVYYKKSLDIQTQLKLYSYMVKKYYNMGLAYDSLKDYKSSIKCYNQCLELAKSSGQKDVIEKSYNGLWYAYRATGDFKNSLLNHELYTMEKDSMLNSESIKNMNEISTKYETEKKQLQIANLEKEKDLQNTELKASRNQKIGLSVGIALSLLLVIIAVRSNQQKKKANALLQEQKNEITHQKEIVDEKQKEIIDSINYAKRIQSTLLAHTDFLNDNIPNNFVLFKPKDIVSGDFYWATRHENLFYLAVCDSTGHGVPGAFMSLLNIGFLSEAINEKNIAQPHEVFNYVRQRLINGISKEGQKDGFDGILLCIDQKTKKMTYCAANNAPIVIRDGEFLELEKDKMPVGIGEKQNSFSTHTIELQKHDSLYLYTDGYADQFGGPKGKKFLYKRLNELLKSLNPDELSKRGDKLNTKFEEWRGSLEQVDDVLVIGIKI
jgi:tetratricopeptide (TPR) repeat protein